MNKSTYLFKVFFALVLTIVFVRCQDEPIETAPSIAPAELVQKSANVSKGTVEGKLRMSIVNMAGSNIEAATGFLDKIYLENLEGQRVEIWDSLEPFDFLDLEEGIGRDIGIVDIVADTYRFAICDIVSAEVVSHGKTYNCVVPGEQMVLEFVEPQVVGYHLSPEFTLVIDMSKSFFPVYSRSLYKNYVMYLMKLKRKKNWKKDFVTFNEFKKNKKPKYFIMNPYVEAKNTTKNGTFFGATYGIDPTIQGDVGRSVFGAGLTLFNDTAVYVTQSLPYEVVAGEDFLDPFFKQGIKDGFFFFENLPAGKYELDIIPYEGISWPTFPIPVNQYYSVIRQDIPGLTRAFPMEVEILKGNISTITNKQEDVPFAYVIAPNFDSPNNN